MKCAIIFALAAVAAVSSEELYSTENDNFDVDGLLKDQEQLQSFANCFNEKSVCEPLAAQFKVDLKEAIELACRKCTEPQKVILGKFMQGLKKQLPAEYEDFKKHYDPENKYFEALEIALAKA